MELLYLDCLCMRFITLHALLDPRSGSYSQSKLPPSRYIHLQLRVLNISLGYFVYDTIACALIEDDRANAAHHLCSIAAVFVGIFQEWVRHPLKYTRDPSGVVLATLCTGSRWKGRPAASIVQE